MTRTSLASIALLSVVMFTITPESHADSLRDEMAALNARWDAAINDPNPDTPGAGADQVRAGDQSQDRQNARPHRATNAAVPRRRGHRMNG